MSKAALQACAEIEGSAALSRTLHGCGAFFQIVCTTPLTCARIRSAHVGLGRRLCHPEA